MSAPQPLRRSELLIALMLAAPIGCTERPDVSAETSELMVRDSAGIQIVENPVDPERPDRPLAVEEVRRIGLVDGAPEYLFDRIVDVAIADDGTLFVAEAGTPEVRSYAPDGTHLRSYSRRGEGPGELDGLTAVHVFGDTVGIVGSQRVVSFTRAGELIDDFRTIDETGMQTVVFGIGPLGWVGLRADARALLSSSEITADSTAIGLIPQRPSDPAQPLVPRPPTWYFPRSDGSSGGAPLRWPPRNEVFSGGRIALTGLLDYEVRIYEPDGTPSRVVRRGLPRWVIDADSIAAIRNLALDAVDEYAATRPDPESRRELANRERSRIEEGLELPAQESAPRTGRLLGDAEGWLWVERVDGTSIIELGARRAGAQGLPRIVVRTWDVLDDTGRYVGTVELPDGFEPLVVRGSEVTGRWRDELDVPYVVTLRVSEEGEP